MFFMELPASTDLIDREIVPEFYRDVLWVGQHVRTPPSKILTKIGFDGDRKKVMIRSGIGGSVPLFYGWTKTGSFVIGDSCERVRQAIHVDTKAKREMLDWVGVIESFLFDGPLSRRTLFEGVSKVQMGEELNVDLLSGAIQYSWAWLPAIQASKISREEAIPVAKRLLRTFCNSDARRNPALLPLTGGLDSRMIAGVLKSEQAIELTSYTFQRGWSVESILARKVSEHLGINHFIVNLPPVDCYQTFAREVVKQSGGMVSGMHCHGIYCCHKAISEQEKRKDRFFGYFGGSVAGELTDEPNQARALNTPKKIFNRYKSSLFGGVVDSFERDILKDLEICFDSFRESGSHPDVFHEYWRVQQRQNNLITHLFSFHRCHDDVRVICPFVNEDLVEFFLSLPYDLRKDRNLFKQAASELYPKLFSLPTMHYSNTSVLAKIENIFEKIESLANKISPRQEWILSPFKYEQHEKNLLNFLRPDIENGAKIVTDYFDISEVSVSFPVWRHGTVKEYYRLAALSYLLE